MRLNRYLAIALAAAVLLPLAASAAEPASAPAIKPRIPLGKDTTFLEGPLKADGTVDYLAALEADNSAGATAKNNGYVLLLKASGTGPEVITPKLLPQFLKSLGIEECKGTFKSPWANLSIEATDALDKDLAAARTRSWKPSDYPTLARGIAENDETLSLVAQAVRREHFYIPLLSSTDGLVGAMLPSLGRFRAMGNLLAARATLRIEQGDIAGSIDDLTTLHLLGRQFQFGDANGLIPLLVGGAIDKMASEADFALATSGKLSLDQALAYGKALDKLPPLPDLARTLDRIERCIALEVSTRLVASSKEDIVSMSFLNRSLSSGPEGAEPPPVLQLTDEEFKSINAAEVLRAVNLWFDSAVAAMRVSDAAKRRAAFEQTCRDAAAWAKCVSDREHPTKAITGLCLGIFAPDLSRAAELHCRVAAYADLSRVAVALAAYHAKHHAYPETLAPLAPDFIAKVPLDRFGGEPLHYIRRKTGYLLYSVGSNLADDDGKKAPNQDAGDYVVETDR